MRLEKSEPNLKMHDFFQALKALANPLYLHLMLEDMPDLRFNGYLGSLCFFSHLSVHNLFDYVSSEFSPEQERSVILFFIHLNRDKTFYPIYSNSPGEPEQSALSGQSAIFPAMLFPNDYQNIPEIELIDTIERWRRDHTSFHIFLKFLFLLYQKKKAGVQDNLSSGLGY